MERLKLGDVGSGVVRVLAFEGDAADIVALERP